MCHPTVIHLPELIAEAFGGSRSEARRYLAQGGVKLNGEYLDALHLDMDASELNGELTVGKSRRVKLINGRPQ